jgi:hypothetical protein
MVLRHCAPQLQIATQAFYIAAFVGIIAIAMIWWWHVANNKP